MNPDEMKLPNAAGDAILSDKFWRREWVIDNIFLQKIDPGILIQMGNLRFNYLADTAQMEADLKLKEADMFRKMANLQKQTKG